MEKSKLIDIIDEFKSGLLSKATDGTIEENFYMSTRTTLMENISNKELIPKFIKSCRNSTEFRRYMQSESADYAGRRRIITEGMNALLEYFEKAEGSSDPFAQIKLYRKVEEIGRGGFGAVYKYRNDCLEMDFAVKVYAPIFVSSIEQNEGERRFFREAKILFGMNHSNIVKIFDAGRIEAGPFIRMEYVEGFDLNGLQERYGTLTFKRSLGIVSQILAGLAYAHQNKIIHRDLKPSNVVFATNEECYKIIDFGVSAFLETDNHTKLTKTGEGIAGGIFIDPLLHENPKLRDVRTDIYSVGAIWYWLLSGRAPHGSNMREYLLKSSTELTEPQINIIMKCLSGDIKDRYDSCETLLSAIEKLES